MNPEILAMLAAMTCADQVMTFSDFSSRFASQHEQAIGDYAEYRIVRGLMSCTRLPPRPEPPSCNKGPFGGSSVSVFIGRAVTFEPMWLNGAWTCVLTSRP